MSRIRVACFTISLDGYGAGPHQDLNNPLGIGNNQPYSLAVFHDNAAFIAKNDIYSINASLALTPIGGNAKKKIMAQLGDATGTVEGWPVAQLGPGVDYLSYWLTIPGPDATWVYHYDEGNWQQFSSSLGRPTFVGTAIVG